MLLTTPLCCQLASRPPCCQLNLYACRRRFRINAGVRVRRVRSSLLIKPLPLLNKPLPLAGEGSESTQAFGGSEQTDSPPSSEQTGSPEQADSPPGTSALVHSCVRGLKLLAYASCTSSAYTSSRQRALSKLIAPQVQVHYKAYEALSY